MAEHSFLKNIEAEYQSALFDEHVTGTPTLYINEVRYTGATDVDSLLLAIKQADTEGHIRFLNERRVSGAYLIGFIVVQRDNCSP